MLPYTHVLDAGLVIPRLPRPALQMAVAIVGAGIMPANFYLHSALVHSRCTSDQPLPIFVTASQFYLHLALVLYGCSRRYVSPCYPRREGDLAGLKFLALACQLQSLEDCMPVH